MFRRVFTFVFLSSLARSQEKVTFDAHVLPVFEAACLNCHNPDKSKGGLDLSTYAATIKGGSGGAIVEAGDPGSRLIAVVRQTIEPKMPPEGDKLGADRIDVLVKWIEGGLLENAQSKARKAPKPKIALTVAADPAARPDGPPPMPQDLLLEPPTLTGAAAPVLALAASPWAPLLAVTSQKQVLLHDSGTLELVGILPFPEGQPVHLAFSPDGRHLTVAGGTPGKSGTTVTFNVVTGSRVVEAGREFDSILAADATPGFRTMITGGPSRLLKFWDVASGEARQSIKKHTDWITALDVSPDGVLVASGDRNGGVWAWEAETGSEFHTLRAHQAAITALAFRSDSNLLASASEDGSVRFWEMNNGSEVRKIDAHPGGVTAFAFARDGRSVSAGRDRKLKLWKADFAHERDLAGNLPALPTAVAIDSDGQRAFVGDADGNVSAFQTSDGQRVGGFPNNPPSVETRIETVTATLAGAREAAVAAESAVTTRTAAVEAARKSLEEAISQLQQSEKILKAARGSAEPNGEAATKLVKQAEIRQEESTALVAKCRTNLQEAEAGLKDATAKAENQRAALPPLEREIRRWKAAAINTRRLEATKQVLTHAGQTEELRIGFTDLASRVGRQADIVNRKRSEYRTLEKFGSSQAADGAIGQEIRATLTAVAVRIGHEQAILTDLEAELASTHTTVDGAACETAEWELRLARHTDEYRKAAP